MFFLIRGHYSEAPFLSFRNHSIRSHSTFFSKALGWMCGGCWRGVTVMGHFWETETPGKVKQAFIYVQALGNISNYSENQSVIRNMSPAGPSCAGPGWLGGLLSLRCPHWRLCLGGAGVVPLLHQPRLCPSNPAYLCWWVSQAALAQLFCLELSASQLQPEGHSSGL